MSIRRIQRVRRRQGFTLLEILLALFLGATLLAAVAAAIRMQLQSTDVGRTSVEEAQIARATLNLIAEDLRNAVYYEQQDLSGAEEALKNWAASGVTLETLMGMATGGLEDAASSLDGSTSSSTSSTSSTTSGGSSEESDDTTLLDDSSLYVRRTAGVYGDLNNIEIDRFRSPRIDEYDSEYYALQTGESVVHLTDLRTRSYFLQQESSITARTTDAVTSTSGLARGDMDRASMAFSAADGLMYPTQNQAVILAPEVKLLEFRYFDGTDWYEEWDTSTRKALPVAVEIQIGVQTSDKELGEEVDVRRSLLEDRPEVEYLVYRRVVWIPLGEPSTPTTDGATSSTTGSESGSSSSSSSSTSGSGAAGGG